MPAAAPDVLRILGLDPGSRLTGYGIIDVRGVRSSYVDSGCIRTPDGEFAARLCAIHAGLSEIIAHWQPQEMAIEQVFLHHNPTSALKLGHARGVALLAAAQAGLPITEYMPAVIKQAVVGTGRGTKEQVQHMVTALLKLPRKPQADAADALAVALCHGARLLTRSRLAEAGGGR
ncbi:Holliday junction endonuclease RuvC [Plasticicumulans acidivorans]|uniref:Crossover junction endodeoxyribonuclease RuvC n=1 Tax=Plasticicumulans acidivorans TaxID=886464 RepID=A0A317MU40_9GAMM|nr:Holliday junction endonuclease RuvC [Plasticicumulans acidivorans]